MCLYIAYDVNEDIFQSTSDPKADIGDSIIRIFIIPVDHGLTLKLYNGQAQPQFKLEQQKQVVGIVSNGLWTS